MANNNRGVRYDKAVAVKVELPLFSNDPAPTPIVYGRNKKYERKQTVPDDILEEMRRYNLHKAFFFGSFDAGKNCWRFMEPPTRAPEQTW